MMIAVYLVSAVLLAIALMIVIEVLRLQGAKRAKAPVRRRPRRQPILEERIRSAFDGPQSQFGQIFVSYAIWRRENQTRLELFSADPWLQLNEFTRSIVVRHLWRALEALAQGSVVIVDQPPQTWSAEINARFDDKGVDPWRPGGAGPQFVRE